MQATSSILTAFFASFVLAFAAGCESGKEVATVGTSSATRLTDDRVSVHADLDCTLVYGMGRGDGKCDADGSDVCLLATWFDASDTTFQHPLFEAKTCAWKGRIYGETMDVATSGAIPKDPSHAKKIRVSTTPDLDRRDMIPAPLVIDSP